MTKSVNVHEAKTHLSRLLDEAVNGEDIVIARSGVPMVHLSPVNKAARPGGFLKGIWPDFQDDDFFSQLSEEELDFWE